jgi:DNA-binding response OmpR family regulator
MWAVMVFPLPVQLGSKLCQDRDNDLVIFAEAGANSYLEKPIKRQITD